MIRSIANSNTLTTADLVIDAVGGTLAAAKLTGASMPSVSGWRAAGHLPSRTFLVFQAELSRLGFSAPAAIWRIDEPDSSGAAE